MTETIRPTDTAGDLLGRLADAGAGLLVATLDGLESGDLVARAAAGRGRLARPEDRGRRRPHRVDPARDRGRPARAGLHARRRARGPRSAASDSRSRRRDGRRRPTTSRSPASLGRRRPRRHEEGRLRRHRHAGPCVSARCRHTARSRCRPRTGLVARASRQESGSAMSDERRSGRGGAAARRRRAAGRASTATGT